MKNQLWAKGFVFQKMTDKFNLLDWFLTENLTSHLLNIFVRQWPLWSNIGQISLSRLPIREDLQAPSLMMLIWALPLHFFFFIFVSTATKSGIWLHFFQVLHMSKDACPQYSRPNALYVEQGHCRCYVFSFVFLPGKKYIPPGEDISVRHQGWCNFLVWKQINASLSRPSFS